MNDYECLRHTKWECKYHIVFIPKYRKKTVYGQLRKDLGPVWWQTGRHWATSGRSRRNVVKPLIEERGLLSPPVGHGNQDSFQDS
jgi:hypothetical protein